MNGWKWLTDDDLMAVAESFAGDLSYYVAGWDYPESAARERDAHAACKRKAAPVDAEMRRRGMRTTRGLVNLG